MPKQHSTANQRRPSQSSAAGKLRTYNRPLKEPFVRWLTIILALHILGLTLYFLSIRQRASKDTVANNPPITLPSSDQPADPYAQAKFFDLVKQDPDRLPTLPRTRNPTDASSDIVLPNSEQVEELKKLDEQSKARQAEVEERLRMIREQREKMEAEAKAIAEAEKQRIATAERERLRKVREAEAKKKTEALAAKKREQERIAKQKAEANAEAIATAKAKAADDAKAKASRLAAQQKSDNSSSSSAGNGGSSSSTGNGSGSGVVADMGWYNNAVLGPAFYSAWNQPAGPDYTNKKFSASVRITVRRDGRVISAEIIRSSGNANVDASVRSALNRVTQLAPLPREYRQPTYSETINFALDS